MIIGILPAAKATAQDSFGYTYKDTNTVGGPTYNWVEISGSGTSILPDSDDYYIGNINLGFFFNYYGTDYSQLAVGNNGLLFSGVGTSEYVNAPITQTPWLHGFIAPYWDDIVTWGSAGGIYYETLGTAPNRIFVVEWFDNQHYSSSSSGITFESILYEGTNNILFQYKDVDFGNNSPDNNGGSATVGIEDTTGNIGLQYSYNQQLITPGLAILFSFPAFTGTNMYLSMSAPASMDHGNMLSYTLFYNDFGSIQASSVILDLNLSPNVEFVSASDGGIYDSATGKVAWNIGTVPSYPNGRGSRVVTVTIPSNIPVGTTIQATASISTTSLEIRYDDNTFSAYTTVTGSNLPTNVGVGPILGNSGGEPSVYWHNAITFTYYNPDAKQVDIKVHLDDNGPDITGTMTKESSTWSYTTTFYPRHGHATVTYTVNPHLISVPYYSQGVDTYCAPACIEMVFDYYGVHIGQTEIAAAARTTISGTSSTGVVRAGHYSSLSGGYPERDLGYSSVMYQSETPWLSTLYSLIDQGYPIIAWVVNNGINHEVVVVGYDPSTNEVIVHDPAYNMAADDGQRGPYKTYTETEFLNIWSINHYAAFFLAPWDVHVNVQSNVEVGDTFPVTADVQYVQPFPFGSLPRATDAKATITLPSGFVLEGETVTKPMNPTEIAAGGSASITWQVRAVSSTNTAEIKVIAEGNVVGFPGLPGLLYYNDRIGGEGKATTAADPNEVPFDIYVDPAGYIYDVNTNGRISGASVWLQRPDGQGGWQNVPMGQTPPIMQPDNNPQVTNVNGQYQWDTMPGAYRVHVEAPGYQSADSIVVSVPPPVFDLHVGLTPLVSTTKSVTVTSDPSGSGLIKVDGTAISTPTTFEWIVGSQHTLEAASIVSGGTGINYAWASWSDGGMQSHQYTVQSSSATIIASFLTKYYLTIDSSGHGTATGAGWYNTGSQATFSISSATVPGGVGTQYVFQRWQSSDTNAYTGSEISHSITMNSPISETAQWKTQYQVSFSDSPSGAGTITPTTTTFYDSGSRISVSATPKSGYAFYSWSATPTSAIAFSSASSASTTATINGPGAITATFAQIVTGSRNVAFTGANNVIMITGGNNVIDCTKATSTTIIKTGLGNNIIYLGEGDNIVKETANGNDIITAGNGNNNIAISGSGNYQITTGSGNDQIQIIGDGNSIIKTGDGSNKVTISGKGNNQITAGNGNDIIIVGDGNNLIKVGDGNNQVTAGKGNNQVTTGSGNDQLITGNGNNNIQTGAGDDKITVGNGNNSIDGGAGSDTLVHGTGHNTILNCEQT